MFRSTGTFDKLLDKATSNLLMEPDWPTILQICDLVRQDDVQPKYVMSALKKKLFTANPHTALYALQVLESLVKNCGSVFHEELTLKVNCDMLHELAKTTQHENVRSKLLELIQAWTFAFRKNPRHNSLKEIVTGMKAEGYKFPALRESDAMFSADSAPEWADGDCCHRCRAPFGLVQRKHHCRNCGQVFCSQCSQKSTPLPKFGIEKEVRVCDACYDQVTKPTSSVKKSSGSKQDETDLPEEYLKSSLAQQSQAPVRKSEEELREEEELQLALALSQSEAEAKEKHKFRGNTNMHSSNKSETRIAERSPSPLEDQPATNPELARYLNRSYWENRQVDSDVNRPTSPSAPATAPIQNSEIKYQINGGLTDPEMQDFVSTLKSQVEIFINRMKSNSSRGRSIANDSSVQTLFLNITAMHSQLLRYIQQHDDSRLYYERLQDKLTQVRDARAALDALRDEHREKLRRQAEEAERLRQLQMAHKLDIMRKKKQEYLQYQRQLALQRVQEQEREMQMRQEQQKQQYLMGSGYGTYQGSPVHGQYLPETMPQNMYRTYPYGQPMMMGVPMGPQNPSMGLPQMQGMPLQGPPPNINQPGPPPGMQPQGPLPGMQSQGPPPGMQSQGPPPGLHSQGPPPGMQQQQQGPPPNMQQQGPPSGMPPQGPPQGMPSQGPPPGMSSQGPPPSMPQQGPPAGLQIIPQQGQIPGVPQGPQQQNLSQTNLNQQQQMGSINCQMPQGMSQQFQQPGAPPASPQIQQGKQNGDAQTAELISFD